MGFAKVITIFTIICFSTIGVVTYGYYKPIHVDGIVVDKFHDDGQFNIIVEENDGEIIQINAKKFYYDYEIGDHINKTIPWGTTLKLSKG